MQIIRLGAAVLLAVLGLAGTQDPASARNRDPFSFYGFYYGLCPTDPAMCRSKPGCICNGNPESAPPVDIENDKRNGSDAAPLVIRIGNGSDAGPLRIRINPTD